MKLMGKYFGAIAFWFAAFMLDGLPKLGGLTAVLVAGANVTALILAIRAFRKRDTVKDEFDRLLGAQSHIGYSEYLKPGSPMFGKSHEGSGIAVDIKNRVIVVASGGKARAYSFDDVRGWETKRFEAGQIVTTAGGVGAPAIVAAAADGIRVAAHNAGAQLRAQMQSGLFVRVRDVENPVWQIHMRQQTLLDRWAEILSQAFGG